MPRKHYREALRTDLFNKEDSDLISDTLMSILFQFQLSEKIVFNVFPRRAEYYLDIIPSRYLSLSGNASRRRFSRGREKDGQWFVPARFLIPCLPPPPPFLLPPYGRIAL